MKKLIDFLNKKYKDADSKYSEANIADHEEKEKQMGIMDTIEDIKEFIDKELKS